MTREEVRDLGRVRRTVGVDRKLAGVAGGLARHLDVDPVLLRVAFVVLAFFGGSGILLYLACWLLLPEDDNPRAAVHLDERSRTFALLAVGCLALLALLADSVGQWGFPWPILAVAVVALVVLTVIDRDQAPRPTAPPVPHVPDPATGRLVPAPPGAVVAPPPHRPANPRRRGPVLFWSTLALAALAIGALGILDAAGLPVAAAAYPAAVVTTCGVMLLLGAFWGRPGGVVLVGLLASLALLGTTAAQDVEGGDITRRPSTAAAVPARLDVAAGEIVLDLTGVRDLAALDGRRIELDAGAGRVELILPDRLGAEVDARVRGPGHLLLFGDERGGIGIGDVVRHQTSAGLPVITVDAEVSVGEIEVRTEVSS